MPPKVRERYKAVTGCKRQLQCEQIFWIFGFITLVALYSVFVTPPIVRWTNIVLKIFMGITYFLIIPITYDYCLLTCTDPVDPNIPNDIDYPDDKDHKMCTLCNIRVKKQTQHCLNCQRCTQSMDHHSQLVNNCISLKNISNYIRLNICFTIMMGIMFAQSTSIFSISQNDSTLKSYLINQWAIVILIILTILSFLFSVSNSIFSIYLRCLNKTRLDYRYRESDSNNSDYSQSDNMDQNQSQN